MRYLASFLFIVSMMCCSTNDNPGLVGSWLLTTHKLECPAGDENFTFNASNGCYTTDGIEVCFEIRFTDGEMGVIIASADGDRDMINFTYTQSGNEVNICEVGDECNIFRLNGNELSLEDTDDGCVEAYIFSRS